MNQVSKRELSNSPSVILFQYFTVSAETSGNPGRIIASQCVMLLFSIKKITVLTNLENLFHIAKRIQSTVAYVATCLNSSS